MVTPKAIVDIIDACFPKAKENMNAQPSLAEHISSSSHHAALSFLLNSLDSIPDELHPHAPEDKTNFFLCRFTLHSCLENKQKLENVHLTNGTGSKSTIPFLRSILEKCPEEILSAEAKELDFIKDADLKRSIEEDLGDMEAAFRTKRWKTVCVFSGVAMESILYYVLKQNEVPAIAKLGKSQEDLMSAKLSEFIKLASKAGILVQDEDKDHVCLAKACKNFRDLIHKTREVRLKEPPSESMAYQSIGAIKMVIERVKGFLANNPPTL